jgi:hypothetical protein
MSGQVLDRDARLLVVLAIAAGRDFAVAFDQLAEIGIAHAMMADIPVIVFRHISPSCPAST